MNKWNQKLHDYWKGKCSDNSLDLPKEITDAMLIFINQIEYLRDLIINTSSDPKPESSKLPVAIFYKDGKPTKKKPK